MDSEWIEESRKEDSVHPRFDPARFNNYKHYIITFHDSTFECIAQGFSFKKLEYKQYEAVVSCLDKF